MGSGEAGLAAGCCDTTTFREARAIRLAGWLIGASSFLAVFHFVWFSSGGGTERRCDAHQSISAINQSPAYLPRDGLGAGRA